MKKLGGGSLRRVRWPVIFAVLVIGSTVMMWHRSGRHWDTVAALVPHRTVMFHSGYGLVWIEIEIRIGSGWDPWQGSETVGIDAGWIWQAPVRYERRLLSAEMGVAYWMFVAVEVFVFALLATGAPRWKRFLRKQRRARAKK